MSHVIDALRCQRYTAEAAQCGRKDARTDDSAPDMRAMRRGVIAATVIDYAEVRAPQYAAADMAARIQRVKIRHETQSHALPRVTSALRVDARFA